MTQPGDRIGGDPFRGGHLPGDHPGREPLRPDLGLQPVADPLGVTGRSTGPFAGAVGAMPAGMLGAAAGVIGVGIDVVAVGRFAAAMQRTPALAHRLFTGPERITVSGSARSPASLAARFAVKEAVAKALGVPAGMDWHDCTVVSESSGRPTLQVTGTVAAACEALGIHHWRISLSHDAGIAAAVVIGLG